jgi:glutaconate CoA-transferase subunit A
LVIDAVAEAPGGSRPLDAHAISDRDNDFYREWDAISRDRDPFRARMAERVLSGVAA